MRTGSVGIDYNEAKLEETIWKRREKTQERESTFPCPLCNDEFPRDEINAHASACGLDGAAAPVIDLETTNQLTSKRESQPRSNSKFVCDKCGKSYIRLKSFNSHQC